MSDDDKVYKYLPNVPPDGPKKAEDLLTKEMLNLSFEDRNAINEEIHGVRNVSPNETPELLQMSMYMLSVELSKIQDKPAYDKSQRLFPRNTYVNTFDFRVRFLRCELFDPKKAAIRMVNFLDFIDSLFVGNNEVLRRPIRITDFNKEETKILRSGVFQLLPYRDRSGRPIYAESGDMGFHYDLKTRMKIRSYFFYVAGNGTESQRKGMVNLALPEGDFTNTPMPLHQESRDLFRRGFASMPIRLVAIHICMPDTLFFRLLRSFILTAFTSMRSRLRFHVSSGVERRYRLQGFGVPAEMIPVTDSGNLKRTYLYQWIKVRKIIESDETGATASSIFLLPGSNDVLIRTGTTTLSHPGNVFFRGLIEAKHKEFRSGSERTQAYLAEGVVEEIERLGGRFLTRDSRGYWTQLNDRSQIVFKVEVSIRDFKVKVRARKNVQTTNSSTHNFQRQDGKIGKRKRLANCVEDNDGSDGLEICACAC